jgi:exosortase
VSISVSAALPVPPAARGRWKSGSRRLAFAGLVLALAYLPFLALHGRLLWSREHYQFFPLLLPGAIALAYRRCADLKTWTAGSRPVAYALAGLAWTLLTLAILLPSPGLSPVAALVLLLAAVFSLGGRSLVRCLLPAWLLLWLAVPLPGQLDSQLVAGLQRLVSSWSSQVLEVLGVLHGRSGDVLEVGGRQLLVEEACSGIHSLLPVLACALFWLGWHRRPFAHGVLLLAAVLPWVVLGNVARIVAVATLDGRAGIDLGQGWGHEALGFVLFAAMLGLVWNTDQWLLLLTNLSKPDPRWLRVSYFDEGEAKLPPTPATPTQPVLSPTAPQARRPMILTAWPVLACFGLLAVAQAPMVGQFLAPVTAPVALPADTVQTLNALGETALAERFGPWRRQGFEVKERPADYWLGQFSRQWRYQAGERSALLAISYPFAGWKEVPGCYDSLGWKVQERQVHDGDESRTTGAYVSACLHRPEEDSHAYLLFQMRDSTGRAVAPPEFTIWKRFRNLGGKLLTWQSSGEGYAAASAAVAPTYQVQLLVESPAALDPAQQQAAQALFRELLRACTKGDIKSDGLTALGPGQRPGKEREQKPYFSTTTEH